MDEVDKLIQAVKDKADDQNKRASRLDKQIARLSVVAFISIGVIQYYCSKEGVALVPVSLLLFGILFELVRMRIYGEHVIKTDRWLAQWELQQICAYLRSIDERGRELDAGRRTE